MLEIAQDEMRHAAFSWDLDDWLGGRLDANARGRTWAARRQAVAGLRASIGARQTERDRRELGLPTREQARALFETLQRTAWS
jgi:hypothetical protein